MNEMTAMPGKAQRWQGLVAEQMRSGESIRVFCEGRGIKRHNFWYWRKRLRSSGGGPDKARPGQKFIPLINRGPMMARPTRILLPNGVAIELGAGLETGVVSQFIRGLCGVGHAWA